MTITVSGLGKAFSLQQGPWHTLAIWLGLSKPAKRWVLRDVDFSIRQGEAVGIIGVNGAGKSTLLKLLTGTSVPSEGHVAIDGRVSALLELGMGFHPDFSGRQNVYLAGQMIGLSAQDIDRLLPEIEAFAEIGDYFNQPVRVYSSGMFVRLAFSVATCVRPEVLIVDEALAVGDQYFQHKSFARIRNFHERGTTLLFVSHDPGALKSLCARGILLGDGRILHDGPVDEVLDRYNALISEREDHAVRALASQFDGRSGNGHARIESVSLRNDKLQDRAAFTVGEPVTLVIRYVAHRFLPDLVAGILIKDRTGYDIYGVNTHSHPWTPPLGDKPGHERILEVRLPGLNIGPGSYSVTVALHSHADHLNDNYDWWERAAVFTVIPDMHRPRFVGVAALDAHFSLTESQP